jgi:hypothetical protein
MATDKKKKEVKVRDLKPSKDAKGGGGVRNLGAHNLGAHNLGGTKTRESTHGYQGPSKN